MSRISVIGAGNVGASVAYACVLTRACSEVIMVDIDVPRCQAQVLDIEDTANLHECKIRTGTFKDAGQSDIIVITAGAKQKTGEARTELIGRNFEILNDCISQMKPFNPSTILLLVSNPVDILTGIAQMISGLPKSQVIGTGTFLDSSRLRAELSTRLNVSASAIHAYVLGEHGDSQFAAFSCATVANTKLLNFPGISGINLEELATATMKKAYKIIDAKGSTYYGIGGCTASICTSILRNTKQIRPVSHYVDEYGVCFSLPCVLGAKGIMQTVHPDLSPDEKEKLSKSASALKAVISEYV